MLDLKFVRENLELVKQNLIIVIQRVILIPLLLRMMNENN